MTITSYKDSHYNDVKALLIKSNLFDDVWDDRDHWAKKAELEPDSILVATIDNELAGCILIVRDPWTSFFSRLAVKAKFQKQGVGSKLIEHAEAYLKKHKSDEVVIFVDPNNKKLQNFYKKRGYIDVGDYKCMFKSLKK